MKVWTVSTCIPDERDPVIPEVFATEAEAIAFLERTMREEWEINAPEDEETGEPLPYPGCWLKAHDAMADNDPDEAWGRYTLACHEITPA